MGLQIRNLMNLFESTLNPVENGLGVRLKKLWPTFWATTKIQTVKRWLEQNKFSLN